MPYQTASTFRQNRFVFFRGLATIIITLREKIAVAIERRRIRGALSELDDYLLKDMGVTRSDIDRIANRTYAPRQ
jgi:uncharacterized protein YjiS (DUF1127 family)